MEKFENQVQELKFKVLKSVAKAAFDEVDFYKALNNIPKEIIPGPKPTMRCCIYKERAVVGERISLGLGGHDTSPNILEVIDVACDDCPLGGHEVTNHCRGCVARSCLKTCPRGAIGFDEATRKAYIDKSKCVNCGMCAKACSYNAIINFSRPCESACATKSIAQGEFGQCVVNNDNCVGCGQCVQKCPFGAIQDKSYIKDVINLLKTKDLHVYAIIAPAIAASFREVSVGQLITGLKQLGFYDVIETAFGADLVGRKEAEELLKRGKITSSCCPAFVSYIKKHLPEYKDYVSETNSPMIELGKYIKEKDKDSKVIFIGPCTAKKYEIKKKNNLDYVNFVLTFEELQAMFEAKEIPLKDLEESKYSETSKFAKGFAASGGVSEAIKNALLELDPTFEFKPMVVSGIKNIKSSLAKFVSSDEYNFFEGMSCEGGCINGPCALHHDPMNLMFLKKYLNK